MSVANILAALCFLNSRYCKALEVSETCLQCLGFGPPAIGYMAVALDLHTFEFIALRSGW